MNEKQQQLQFEKGITNVPSDLLCSDNTLEESVGMIYDNSEHRVIQKPAVFVDTETPILPILEGFHLLYVHKFNDEERYIGYTFDDSLGHHANYLCYATKSGTTLTYRELPVRYTDSTKVTSVGKTLIVSDEDGVHYLLWKYTPVVGVLTPDYEDLGDIPSPSFKFWLNHYYYTDISGHPIVVDYFLTGTASCEGIIHIFNDQRRIEDNQQEEYNDLVIGLYSKNKKRVAQKKAFCEPFFVRGALELYDGSYTHITQPILMLPCFDRNSYSFDNHPANFIIRTYYAKLLFDQTQSYIDWSDIVKNVVIFVSDSVCPFDLLVDQELNQVDQVLHGISINGEGTDMNIWTHTVQAQELQTYCYYDAFVQKKYNDLINDIKALSVFYKLCEIGIDSVSNKDIAQYTGAHVLDNLNTQEILEYDDYFSRSKLFPEYMYAYNSRLNFANVSRSMFEGFGSFLPWENSSPGTYTFYVKIRTDVNDIWVSHVEETKEIQGLYFYYPDSRALHVTIYKTGLGCICDQDLEEHPYLNGAYYLGGMPIDPTTNPATTYTEQVVTVGLDGFHIGTDTTNNDYKEILPNYIITSEVNNPWVFKAEGYNKVGTGKIIGMSTITQALSQGQFGQYPLLVFSESGIWAMSVDNTGLFKDIHPMSREVCNNAGSITQTDGAVFFTSEKGLMVVVGSEVKCVSEQLSGRETNFTGEIAMGNIRDYMKDCFIAYDYRDSLLWIFNNSRTHVVSGQTVPFNTDYCYVYAIKSGTFGKYRFANAITNVVNNYPDYLLQSGSTLFSLTGRQNINLDTDPYSGLMITRPMKLENGLALKSLMQIKNLRQFSSGATLQLTLYASNDCEHWVQIPSLRGTPFKYWRFRFDFAQMKATDRYAGTIVITQERRIDKLR